MQDLNQSIYSVCHDSEMRPQDIAAAMGIGYQVFLNKANPNCDTHHFTAPQLVQLQKVTGSNLITTTMAALLRNPVSVESIGDLCMASVLEHAEAVKAVWATSGGALLNARQLTNIKREIAEAKQALDELEDAVNANGSLQSVKQVVNNAG